MTTKTKGTQKPWECEHCGKVGKNRANYRRDHGNRCPVYLERKTLQDRLIGLMVGIAATSLVVGVPIWVM